MRLIDADELIKDIDYSADMGGALGTVVKCVKYYVKFMVASAPTIEERKKGKWILHEGYKGAGWYFRECPFCHEKGWTIEMNYCPNCGARMKGEEE